MRRGGLAAVVLLSGCAGLGPAASKEAVLIEAEAEVASGPQAAGLSLAAARRGAVDAALELYLSTAVRREKAGLIDSAVLGDAARFIKESRTVYAGPRAGSFGAKIRAQVLYPKLAAELERLGLRPQAAPGPRALLAIEEAEPRAAAAAVRRALSARGYSVSDSSGAPSADVVIAGKAAAAEVADPRLAGFHAYRAAMELKVSGGLEAALDSQAAAVDAAPEGAAAKSLANAGGVMGEKLGDELSGRFQENWEVSAVVAGLKGFEQVREFLREARRLPGIKGLWVDSLAPAELRARLSTTAPAADIAAAMARMKGWQIKLLAVDSDFVELESVRD